MLRTLASLALLLTGADHWTTYLCLRTPVDGWEVVEANPIAEQLFEVAGLVPGLLLDSCVTLVAILFLVTTSRFGTGIKAALLGFITLTTSYAVANNLIAISDLGISPLGIG